MIEFRGRGVKKPYATARPVGDFIVIRIDDAENPEAWWEVMMDLTALGNLFGVMMATLTMMKGSTCDGDQPDWIDKWCADALENVPPDLPES